MRRRSSILILFVLLACGVSLAVPAEDVPETAYDELEGLPYEGTPVFSVVVPRTSARMFLCTVVNGVLFPGGFAARFEPPARERNNS